MKIISCPLNGPRNSSEFAYGGEVRVEPAGTDDPSWADFVWCRENRAGVVREWWCHVPSGYWFIAERNTVTDEFLATYPAASLRTGSSL
jgi:sarcosine oxidase subunit delta